MPIYRLIGVHVNGTKWNLSAKLVQSIDDMQPLVKVLPLISRKYNIPSMKSYKMYACDASGTPVREIDVERALKEQGVEPMGALFIAPAEQVLPTAASAAEPPPPPPPPPPPLAEDADAKAAADAAAAKAKEDEEAAAAAAAAAAKKKAWAEAAAAKKKRQEEEEAAAAAAAQKAADDEAAAAAKKKADDQAAAAAKKKADEAAAAAAAAKKAEEEAAAAEARKRADEEAALDAMRAAVAAEEQARLDAAANDKADEEAAAAAAKKKAEDEAAAAAAKAKADEEAAAAKKKAWAEAAAAKKKRQEEEEAAAAAQKAADDEAAAAAAAAKNKADDEAAAAAAKARAEEQAAEIRRRGEAAAAAQIAAADAAAAERRAAQEEQERKRAAAEAAAAEQRLAAAAAERARVEAAAAAQRAADAEAAARRKVDEEHKRQEKFAAAARDEGATVARINAEQRQLELQRQQRAARLADATGGASKREATVPVKDETVAALLSSLDASVYPVAAKALADLARAILGAPSQAADPVAAATRHFPASSAGGAGLQLRRGGATALGPYTGLLSARRPLGEQLAAGSPARASPSRAGGARLDAREALTLPQAVQPWPDAGPVATETRIEAHQHPLQALQRFENAADPYRNENSFVRAVVRASPARAPSAGATTALGASSFSASRSPPNAHGFGGLNASSTAGGALDFSFGAGAGTARSGGGGATLPPAPMTLLARQSAIQVERQQLLEQIEAWKAQERDKLQRATRSTIDIEPIYGFGGGAARAADPLERQRLVADEQARAAQLAAIRDAAVERRMQLAERHLVLDNLIDSGIAAAAARGVSGGGGGGASRLSAAAARIEGPDAELLRKRQALLQLQRERELLHAQFGGGDGGATYAPLPGFPGASRSGSNGRLAL
jgi:hypothetical protein